MSKALYGGISNIAHKAISLYGGIDNIARKAVKAYIGDENGFAKQFWPNIVYTWERYAIINTTYYYWNKYNRVSNSVYEYSMTRYSDGNTRTCPRSTIYYGTHLNSFNTSTGYWDIERTGSINRLNSAGCGYFGYSSRPTTVYRISSVSYDSSQKADIVESQFYAKQTGKTLVSTTYSKGSTSYGEVSSTNRSAYPDNNYSGSYWYVYSTSGTIPEKSNLIDTITSEDPTSYPDNGILGSYWYVKIES